MFDLNFLDKILDHLLSCGMCSTCRKTREVVRQLCDLTEEEAKEVESWLDLAEEPW